MYKHIVTCRFLNVASCQRTPQVGCWVGYCVIDLFTLEGADKISNTSC